MSTKQPASRKPLRLWPGIAVAVLLVIVRLMPVVVDEIMPIAMMGAVVGGLLILLWWLFLSRAPWSERLGISALMIVALFATSRLVHESIMGGAMGFLLYVWAIPTLALALVASLVATRRLSSSSRRASMVVAILLACGLWTLIRTEGVTSDLVGSDFRWRWTPSPEQQLLAQAADNPPAASPAAAAETPKEPVATTAGETPAAPAPATTGETPEATPGRAATAAHAPGAGDPGFRRLEWPGFRGPDRNSIVRGVRIDTDWSRSAPAELWRRPIGPGWSSFAVDGSVLYTQEQRGEQELVTAYKVSTGEPVWQHRDAVRFWESNGGAGPRGTPTLGHGRVYTCGATGIVNALNASNGALIWSRNAATDTGVEIPAWGFASSPLVVGELVIVAASGRLVAYAAATGEQRWLGPEGGAGYSSPHLATIDGVAQILLLRGSRTISVAPRDGSLLWEHTWDPGVGIVQPAVTDGNGVLISTGDAMGGIGMRRIDVSRKSAGWTVEARWTSRGLKPYYNDFVVHKGHAYGFDGSILASIDLADGNRKWKGGRYGSGQMVLLPDQDVLLVLSEEGELALVSATPDKFTEVARFKAIEGKTWNHPVVIGDLLLVRNGEEMAAFRLPLAPRTE
jgi:outer membrane protein assembly factor BamB